MSALGHSRSDEVDDVVLVFRPPENPAAQIAGITPFKSLRLKLDELLDWFKGLNVDSIELWIEGAYRSGNRTELFLSRSEEHTSELQSQSNLVCRLLLEKKKNIT